MDAFTTTWPEYMEEEDTNPGLATKARVENGCKYREGEKTPELDGHSCDSDHPTLFLDMKQKHLRALKRFLRAWPICNYTGEPVSVKYRIDGNPRAPHFGGSDHWSLRAVFYCESCASRYGSHAKVFHEPEQDT